MSAKLGYVLPGTKTIPEQIAADKSPYYLALEAADESFASGRIDVSSLERILESYLAAQLLEVHDQATKDQSNGIVARESLSSAKASQIVPVVQYRYRDAIYIPDYNKIIDEALKTANKSERKNWIERNSTSVLAISSIIAAIIGAIIAYVLK